MARGLNNSKTYPEQSTFEWRRFGHWESTAEKARLSAFLLWHSCEPKRISALQRDANYPSADAGLALMEGFRRESSVALELIVKAVIAERLKIQGAPRSIRVPISHNLPNLWADAHLPDLDATDRYRLLLVRSTLMWSGRYATPKSAKAWNEENMAFAEVVNSIYPKQMGKLRAINPISYDWGNFDRLFCIARNELNRLQKLLGPE
jgi:hypothetical protein